MNNDTDLSARGIVNGLIVGLCFWCVFIGGLWAAWRAL